MKLSRVSIVPLATVCILATVVVGDVFSQEHIRDLGAVREAMTEVGNALPELIKNAEPKYLRTLERAFEINNYALVTIESYMKMVKVAITSGGAINKDIIGVLNGWLGFIRNYCEYDVKYFDEALAETNDSAITAILKTGRDNIMKLKAVSEKGVKENMELSKKL